MNYEGIKIRNKKETYKYITSLKKLKKCRVKLVFLIILFPDFILRAVYTVSLVTTVSVILQLKSVEIEPELYVW